MRNPKEKIRIDKKYSPMGQYGESEDTTSDGEFETMEEQEEKYARSVGMFIISFSYMEDAVDRELAKLINERAHEPGYRIIKYLSFRDKINLLKDEYSSLIKGVCPKDKQEKVLIELKTIYGKLVELSEFRNRVAHANWSSLDKAGFVRSKILENKEEYGMSFEKIKMTPGVLIKFIRQNNSVSNKLDPFTDKIWEIHNKEERQRYRQTNKKIPQ